jgi:trimethylamine---corrinoid protein Co-methyltransferase
LSKPTVGEEVRRVHGEGRGRPESRRRTRVPGFLERQAPWRLVRNPFRPFEIISADELEAIHLASLRILEETGISVQSERARSLLARHGARAAPGEQVVRLDRDFVLSAIADAPSLIEMTARNRARDIRIGEGWLCHTPVSGAPNCSGLDGGRRQGSFEDYAKFLKLAQVFNVIHLIVGYPVEPIDIPVPVRHLVAGEAMLSLTDKVPRIYCHTPQRARDLIEMVRLSQGLSHEAFAEGQRCIAIINTNSPLQLDAAMVDGIIEMAEANQPSVITPFTLAGAMAPVTLAGALAQQNAEALAGIVVSQLARRGAPVVYGAFTTNVNMKSGVPAFGTPEYAKAALISGQLARRYRLPFRSSNINTSNAPDAQAVYEAMMATWSAIMGGANLLHQSAGWLEGGLTASFEKFVIDAEILQMFSAFLTPVEVDEATLATSVVSAVGHGGHFFAQSHTLERYETAFYQPLLSDWRSFEAWREAGAKDATTRANEIAREALGAWQEPVLEPSCREALSAFVARRSAEGGAPVN